VTVIWITTRLRARRRDYRAFEQGAEDNREALRCKGKLQIPTLAIWGAVSNSGPSLETMMHEVADHVTGLQTPSAAHWIPEENPRFLADNLVRLLTKS
jgi:pimeloyl-ACP methyl ester carboxylesterase